ncbi:four-carbon acid sugar kinase family protein [Brevibacterium sp. JSBI002]|uniref:four-carbon acid sugar kinase family protein n=1 Tax=Brevibacterium sp. JSBI002 TaxID=2886045 RepID=UPI00222F5A8A|nr:four-carbon acid sugar kinase family protein [Brevibacterium sp. JSBI002]UZD62850.1 four-carbon acid sugar kinase family protein [Brevibacterium sp. JSBI002]
MTTPAVLVVADDLTGATDASVQFARAGWQARLQLDESVSENQSNGTVSARVTDARAMNDDEASQLTRDAVLTGTAGQDQRLFLKIDSTLRGSVAAQIDGALAGWKTRQPEAVALVCPAYPAMGRTVIGGRLLVDGVPVDETAIGNDPVTPVTTSFVAEILPDSEAFNGFIEHEQLRRAIKRAQDSGAASLTVDARTDNDLSAIAEVVAEFGGTVIPVGSAGLASALSTVWGSELESREWVVQSCRRLVIVASSLHTVTREQIVALTESMAGTVEVWKPDLTQILHRESRRVWLEEVRADDSSAPVVVIDAPAGRTVHTDLVAEFIAETTAELTGSDPSTGLMLLGGEGAQAVLNRFGARGLLIHSTVREGIPIGTIDGGNRHGTTVVTKAGGFGHLPDVAHIAADLLGIELEGKE